MFGKENRCGDGLHIASFNFDNGLIVQLSLLMLLPAFAFRLKIIYIGYKP